MKLKDFVVKIDGINDLTRTISVWNPIERKEYDCDVWVVRDTIYIVPKLSVDEIEMHLKNIDEPEEEGGCHCY